MTNLTITFSYPWLLLVLIPALLVSFIPYFMLNKKFRRTRNRIISLILHTTVMVLAIMMLAGLRFDYYIPNTTNEIILLVDVSDTADYTAKERDDFVRDVIADSGADGYNVALVTFGFDQVLAAPFTNDVGTIYDLYMSAEKPDVTASNIASALRYSAGLFRTPDQGKIVLITDGKETDEEALQAIRYVTSQGTRLDVVYVPSDFEGIDTQILEIKLPTTRVVLGAQTSIDVLVYANESSSATITMADNGRINESTGTMTVDINPGTNTITFAHSFSAEGLHKLDFNISLRRDDIVENNTMSTYYNLQIFDDILLIANSEESMFQSEFLNEILTADQLYTVKSTYFGAADCPTTLDELREYNEIILNNIARADMPEGFEEMLYSYVHEYGGGLFTVGGSENGEYTTDSEGNEIPVAHAYDRDDMYNSAYKDTIYPDMLPVQAIDYTPPVGVVFLIDRSGSMGGTTSSGITRYEYAKVGLAAAMSALTERDYMSIISFDTSYNIEIPLTPLTQQSTIKAAIANLADLGGGTLYCDALSAGVQQLASTSNVEKRHIVLLTDGQIGASERVKFELLLSQAYRDYGITLSVVVISTSIQVSTAYTQSLIDGTATVIPGDESIETTNFVTLMRAVWIANDVEEVPNRPDLTRAKRQLVADKCHIVTDPSEIPQLLRYDVMAPDIQEVEYKDFNPTAGNLMSPLLNGVLSSESESIDKIPAQLSGFYGTRVRASAELVLKGDYNVPIYAQWQYGKGSVGSFMADLYGQFSADFIASASGKQFVLNVVENLMSIDDLKPTEISCELEEDNYINKLNLISTLEEGQSLTGSIAWQDGNEQKSVSLSTLSEAPDPNIYVTTPLSAANNFSRAEFVIKQSGTYTITINKVDAEGNVLDTAIVYKSFSYSKEYDENGLEANEDIIKNLQYMASGGNGAYIDNLTDTGKIFETFEARLYRYFDPRVLFSIIIIVCFLLEIAVRKFKFKWLHEIIRDRRDKRNKKSS